MKSYLYKYEIVGEKVILLQYIISAQLIFKEIINYDVRTVNLTLSSRFWNIL